MLYVLHNDFAILQPQSMTAFYSLHHTNLQLNFELVFFYYREYSEYSQLYFIQTSFL